MNGLYQDSWRYANILIIINTTLHYTTMVVQQSQVAEMMVHS